MNKFFKGLIASTLALSCVSPIAMGAEDNKAEVPKERKTDDSYSFRNCFKKSTTVKVIAIASGIELLGLGGLGAKLLGLI